MKKCCFIIVYFGKLPNYFQLFLKSCSYNKKFNWLIFTNDVTNYDYPSNVSVVLTTFEKIKKVFQEKFDFEISIETPYKLCDFKPSYGYVFEEYIKDYECWGYCDLDMLFGNLENFITDEMIEKYDKMFCLGHCVIFKNNEENNRIFMEKIDGKPLYKEIYTTNENMIFDENYCNTKNVHDIFLNLNRNVLEEDYSINFKILPTKFIKIKFDSKSRKFIEDKKKSLYIFDKGCLKRYYIENKRIFVEEFMYIHFQERKMKFKKNIMANEIFKIIPNYFLPLEKNNITYKNFKKFKTKKFCIHYLEYHYKWKKKRFLELINRRKKYENKKG